MLPGGSACVSRPYPRATRPPAPPFSVLEPTRQRGRLGCCCAGTHPTTGAIADGGSLPLRDPSLLLACLAEPCLEGNVCTHGFGPAGRPAGLRRPSERTEEVNLSQGPRILEPTLKAGQTCLTRVPNFPEFRVNRDVKLSLGTHSLAAKVVLTFVTLAHGIFTCCNLGEARREC